MKLSIIIVSYINEVVLRDCLLSIDKYNDMIGESEIIVVDNSPTLELFNNIKRDFPSITVIKNENKGFGHGNNVGCEHANGEYLLFLNPDTILIEPIFKEAIRRIEKDNKIGMAGMKLLNANLGMNMSFHYLEENTFLRAQSNKICNKKNIFKQESMYISGADMLMRKETFELVGRFDEKLFMYFEESDLTRRLHSRGFYNCFFEDLHLIHLEGASTEGQKVNRKTIEREMDSYMYYCGKFDIDFHKQILKKRKYAKFKQLLYSFKKSTMVEYYEVAISVYNDYLK